MFPGQSYHLGGVLLGYLFQVGEPQHQGDEGLI